RRLRRRARAAQAVAPRARGRQAGLHDRERRDAARDRPPGAEHAGGARLDQGHRAGLHRASQRVAARAAHEHRVTLRSGFAAGVGAYVLWGLFPLYWPLLAPAAPVEILAHRVLWSAVFAAVVLAPAIGFRWVATLGRR